MKMMTRHLCPTCRAPNTGVHASYCLKSEANIAALRKQVEAEHRGATRLLGSDGDHLSCSECGYQTCAGSCLVGGCIRCEERAADEHGYCTECIGEMRAEETKRRAVLRDNTIAKSLKATLDRVIDGDDVSYDGVALFKPEAHLQHGGTFSNLMSDKPLTAERIIEAGRKLMEAVDYERTLPVRRTCL